MGGKSHFVIPLQMLDPLSALADSCRKKPGGGGGGAAPAPQGAGGRKGPSYFQFKEVNGQLVPAHSCTSTGL